MVRRTSVAAAAMIAAVLLLSACTGVPAADEETPQSDAASEQPTPSATPTAADLPAAPSCLQIDTTEPTVDGATLGTCISDALHASGTFKAEGVNGEEQLEAEIRLRPDIAMHGVSPDSEVIVVDGVAYENEGDGWKQGDPDSEDSDEAIIWAAGQFALAAFSGDIMQQTIAACAVWNIEVGAKRLTLPDSEVVEARVLTCAAPFDMYGTTVSPMEVWMGEDWTPYGYESTATGYGQVVEGRSLYYDHGIDVDITAPM